MYTLESAITEYLKLARPEFCANNRAVPTIFSAAATALASRMWVEGTDLEPATFYIALIGKPRSGKSAFFRSYIKLFRGTGINEIPIGSPESMLKSIDAIRYGYIYYDEVAHLAKLLDSYMGTLLPLLNKAYYLDGLSQTRMDNKKSIVIEPESYFVHVLFGGVPSDWATIERKAVGGFIRRTLVIPVRGHIPFFKKPDRSLDELHRLEQLRTRIRHILKAMTRLDLTVYLPEYSELRETLDKAQMSMERKSMVEEYLYKIIAGRVVANLITFDLSEPPATFDTNKIVHRIEDNASKLGIKVVVEASTNIIVKLYVPETTDPKGTLTGFLAPNYHRVTFDLLMSAVKPQLSAPDEITRENVDKIREFLDAGGPVVVSKRRFIQEILHTRNPQFYKPVLEILQDAGYIRIVDYVYKNRNAQYVILDPSARVCGNCEYYQSMENCPRLKGVFDLKEAVKKVPPWAEPCDKFSLTEEEGGGR